MTFEDEARNDLQRAWEYSADNLRQRVTGTSPTTEETLDTLKDLFTAAADNTVRLAALCDTLWAFSQHILPEVEALKQQIAELEKRI